jgi:hypothetical protein
MLARSPQASIRRYQATGLHLNQQTLWQQWKSTAPDGVRKSRGITSPVFRTWAAAQREEAECCDGLAVGSALFVDANIVNAMVIMRLMFMPILSCVSSTCEATSNRQTSHGQRASNSALTKQLGSLRRPVSIWQRATNRSLVMRTTCAGNVISKSLALPKLGSARHGPWGIECSMASDMPLSPSEITKARLGDVKYCSSSSETSIKCC